MIDGNSFASVFLTNIETNQQYLLAVNASNGTSVTFYLSDVVSSGTYDVRVRNEIGESNALTLQVKWSVGTTSWSSGGSTAGGIISLKKGSGYPPSIDFFKFVI